jgi:hypothetical protein
MATCRRSSRAWRQWSEAVGPDIFMARRCAGILMLHVLGEEDNVCVRWFTGKYLRPRQQLGIHADAAATLCGRGGVGAYAARPVGLG